MAECVYPLEIDNLELDAIIIGDTPYGRGVFASKKIKGAMPIGKIEGEFHHDKKYDSEYAMSFNDGALEPEEPYKFVNHSCEPNCELVELVVADQNSGKVFHELWIYALTDIKRGEQLTLDYAWPYTDAIECQCGSPNCRGWIVAANEVEKVVAKKGLGSRAASGENEPTTKKTRKKAVKKAVVKAEEEPAPVKKTRKKTVAVKEPKSESVKKTAKKAAKKTVAKKTTAKKAVAKKTVTKKAVAKKTVAKKSTAKKTVAKKKASK